MDLWLVLAAACLMAVAGCASPPATEPTGKGMAAAAAPMASQPVGLAKPILDEVRFDGDVGTWDCLDAVGQGLCPVGALGPPSDPMKGTLLFKTSRQGPHVVASNLTLTWTTSSPTTSSLAAEVNAYVGCPDRCSFQSTFQTVSGTSPLTIRLADLGLHENQTFGILFQPMASHVGPTQETVSVGQPFHLEGVLTYT